MKNGFYVLPGRQGLYDLRIEREKIAAAKWKKFLKTARWFQMVPYLRGLMASGSMALGITIGVIALLTNTAVLLPFFVPIFVIESLSVIVQMISKKVFKRKIFLSTPIHHHFEAIGWHESKVTMRFWIISVVSCGLGLAIFFLSRIF